MGAWGWPPQIQHLKSMAKSILTAKKRPLELSQHWYKNFLTRHLELKVQFARGLNQKWKDTEDLEIIKEWFNLYKATIIKYAIPPGDQYNIDKKGIAIGLGNKIKVLIPQSEA